MDWSRRCGAGSQRCWRRRSTTARPIVSARGGPCGRPSALSASREGWRLHASAILAKTKPLRTVLGDLGFAEATDGRFFFVENGGRAVHPDWMAAVRDGLPATVLLE